MDCCIQSGIEVMVWSILAWNYWAWKHIRADRDHKCIQYVWLIIGNWSRPCIFLAALLGGMGNNHLFSYCPLLSCGRMDASGHFFSGKREISWNSSGLYVLQGCHFHILFPVKIKDGRFRIGVGIGAGSKFYQFGAGAGIGSGIAYHQYLQQVDILGKPIY